MTSSRRDEPDRSEQDRVSPSPSTGAELPAMDAGRVAIENAGGQPCDLDALTALANFAMDHLGLHEHDELSIRIVDESEMTELHVEWMGEPGATDVLSFPMDELEPVDLEHPRDAGMLGDIVLCPAFAGRQALADGHDAEAIPGIIDMLLVHGILHLIGHDHATAEEYDRMFALQDEVLSGWRLRVAPGGESLHG